MNRKDTSGKGGSATRPGKTVARRPAPRAGEAIVLAADKLREKQQRDASQQAERRFLVETRLNELRAARDAGAGDLDDGMFSPVLWKEIGESSEIPLNDFGTLLCEGIHWISGAPGSGKTIFAYWNLLQYAREGFLSAIYECEMGPERAKGLLRNLGATDEDLGHINYYRADQDGEIIDLVAHGRSFCMGLVRDDVHVLLYDAAAPLLAAAGKDENYASDVRLFVNMACRPLAENGGLVMVLDHTGHNNADRSRGSSDKAAACDVNLVLKVVSPFARGVSGRITLECSKDRSGTLVLGSVLEVEVSASPDGRLDLTPGKWEESEKAVLHSLRAGVGGQSAECETLRGIGRAATAREVAFVTGKSVEATRSSLKRAAKNGSVAKIGDDKWLLV